MFLNVQWLITSDLASGGVLHPINVRLQKMLTCVCMHINTYVWVFVKNNSLEWLDG